MVKGVNRYTVEISRMQSPYFERAICFVKPEFAKSGGIDLHRAAARMVCEIDGSIEPDNPAPAKEQDVRKWLVTAICTIAGAVIGIIIGSIF
ncbi:MAG: hypothetical protein J6L81_04255 [Clostridia bacterium]|nr:hypothetical protein [Clostridia bacterium]